MGGDWTVTFVDLCLSCIVCAMDRLTVCGFRRAYIESTSRPPPMRPKGLENKWTQTYCVSHTKTPLCFLSTYKQPQVVRHCGMNIRKECAHPMRSTERFGVAHRVGLRSLSMGNHGMDCCNWIRWYAAN